MKKKTRLTVKESLLLFVLICVTALSGAGMAFAEEPSKTYVVVLDPGHGGYDSGAESSYGGMSFQESELTLLIAKYCYQMLKKEPNLKVYMTRKADTYVGVGERVVMAAEKRADLLVSFHLNSVGETNYTARGCMVLVSAGTYRPYLAKKEDYFTGLVLKNLNAVGIPTSLSSDNGRYYRMSGNGSTYPNGKERDYYGIVANSVEQDFPGVIIEHCFLSNPTECANFLSSKAKLKKIGQADAKAIISYFNSEAAGVDYGKEEKRDPEWVRVGGKYYYRLSDGTYYNKGWLILNKKRYYLKEDGSRAERFCRIKGNYYFFRPEGYAATGRYRVNNSYYLFTGTGKMIAKGWYVSSKGRHYYTYPIKHAKKGRLLVNGEYIINGKVYRFNSLGMCTNFEKAKAATADQIKKLETIA